MYNVNHITRTLRVLALMAVPAVWGANQNTESENLIVNGGFEEVKEVDVTTGYFRPYNNFFSKDGSNTLMALIPSKGFDQFHGHITKFIIVEGQAGKEVHSGKYALLISGKDDNGGFYLRLPNSFLRVQPGEMYEFSCWVKGDGKVALRFGLLDSLKKLFANEITKPDWVKTEGGNWQEVKQQIEVPLKEEAANWAHLAVLADGDDIVVDDLFLRKVE